MTVSMFFDIHERIISQASTVEKQTKMASMPLSRSLQISTSPYVRESGLETASSTPTRQTD